VKVAVLDLLPGPKVFMMKTITGNLPVMNQMQQENTKLLKGLTAEVLLIICLRGNLCR
jgi:hypothetical protein